MTPAHGLTRAFFVQHIKDRISEQNFSNSKVRITNVDAQSSDDNILIQVLGDIAFSDASPRHFVQSFVLSKQPNGYFVLNDIFRFIKEEVEEEPIPEELELSKEAGTSLHEPAPAAVEIPPLVKPTEKVVNEEKAAVADDKVEKVKAKEEAAPAEVNGTSTEAEKDEDEDDEDEDEDEPAPVAPESEITVPAEDPAAEVINEAAAAAEKAAATEKPVETAASATAQDSAAATSSAPRPAVPKTWARMAASANRVATPVIPATSKPSAPSSQTRGTSAAEGAPKVAAPASTGTSAAAASIPPAPSPQPASSTPPAAREGSPDSAGWQSVGPDHSRKQSRSQGATKQEESVRAYVKNVNTVTTDELSTALSRFGHLDYVDVDSAKVRNRPSVLFGLV